MVIAIISILAAMLLTVVSRSKNNAGKVTDINNLRQIMLTLHAYSSDSEDILPPPNWDNGGFADANGTNAGWLYTPDLSATGTDRYKVNTGLFWSTLGNAQVYFCPMDRPQEARMSDHDGQVEQRQQQISSYAMNGAVIGYLKMAYPPVRLAAMHPGDCAFWETDETEPYYFNDGANWPREGVSARHYQGAIQSAFDASVSYIKLDKWYEEVAETGKNRLWCYPNSDDGR